MKKIRLVCATRVSASDFWTKTLLGRSLSFFRDCSHEFELRLFPENKLGLPVLYNLALDEVRNEPQILVFVHDDVHFLDFFWPASIREGLASFDLIGLAGCKRRYPRQMSWILYLYGTDSIGKIERCDASGMIGHLASADIERDAGQRDLAPAKPITLIDSQILSYFGPPRQQVCLLDGVLLACNSNTLVNHEIRFDERFEFHYYDMDLCRQFERKELRMGTWSISVLHASQGSYNSQFFADYPKFANKWGNE